MDKKEDGGVNHMPRKRVTQIFPFLLPLRRWQRKKFFYYKMRKDGCRYAGRTDDSLLPDLVFPVLHGKNGEHDSRIYLPQQVSQYDERDRPAFPESAGQTDRAVSGVIRRLL